MKIVLIGIQGAGKSTQGNLLSSQLKIPYLSTGHIFRDIAKEKTQMGRHVKELLNAGVLIPDKETIDIVSNYLSRPEYKHGYILDGFPRTLHQAKMFANNVDKVVHIKIDDKEALWRLAYRDEKRDDNTIQAIAKRIEMFHKHTGEVIEYYRNEGKLVELDGNNEIEAVNQEILKSLGKQLIKNHITSWHQKEKKLVAIVGLPGAGKSEAADYLSKKGLPIIKTSDVINDHIDRHNLKHDEKTHSELRVKMRKDHGLEAMTKLNYDKIMNALNDHMVVGIEGLRSWEEYEYLKKHFPQAKTVIIGLFADKETRYSRISKRKYRSELGGEERDLNEIFDTNLGPTVAFADFIICNNGTRTELHYQLENAYRIIHFT